MGARGPVPKRSTERRRRNKADAPEIVVVTVEENAVEVAIPPVDESWHSIARDWYLSLEQSGQSKFFEPSDWQAARYVAELISKNLRQRKISAVMFAAVWSAMADLLTTEGARRRVRMEIERKPDGNELPANVTAIAGYQARLAAKAS